MAAIGIVRDKTRNVLSLPLALHFSVNFAKERGKGSQGRWSTHTPLTQPAAKKQRTLPASLYLLLEAEKCSSQLIRYSDPKWPSGRADDVNR
jgi:hypothetical protein